MLAEEIETVMDVIDDSEAETESEDAQEADSEAKLVYVVMMVPRFVTVDVIDVEYVVKFSMSEFRRMADVGGCRR